LLTLDLIDSAARVSELSRLVSELPPPNYALLRALTAHLILIVRNSATNKMTLRNIGIVFSPTLGIPAGIFSELVSSFGPIFDDDPVDAVVADSEESTVEDAEETVKRKRNSMLYQAGGADTMLGLGGRHLDPGELIAMPRFHQLTPAAEDSASEGDSEADESETPSIASDDDRSTTHSLTPRPEGYPSAAAVRKAKAAARAANLSVDASNAAADAHRSPGLPGSPRPSGPV
jgi:RalA-binding protein 1